MTELDVKELFRNEIAKWKDEDPLFMAYVYGYEAGKKDGVKDMLDELDDYADSLPPYSGKNMPKVMLKKKISELR
jgi:hypothetical protein